jgi:histone H3/H4
MSENVFPHARVKRIIKTDPDVKLVSAEAIALISKSTELFLEEFATQCHQQSTLANRKTIQYKDLVVSTLELEQFDFLQEVLQEKY